MWISESMVKDSFTVSYLFLFGLTVVTFIEALRTKSQKVRNILNVETAVSLVAGSIYYIFMTKLESKALQIEEVTPLRYIDWCITTPMLLLVILMFFEFEQQGRVPLHAYGLILLFNYLMLACGYLGETNKIDKKVGCIIGFLFYVAILVVMWNFFLSGGRATSRELLVFVIFSIVWGLYGVAYLLKVYPKNLMYNVLDVIAKAFFGVFMWVYYSNVFVIG